MREKCLVKDNCELLNQPLQIPYKQFEVCVIKLQQLYMIAAFLYSNGLHYYQN